MCESERCVIESMMEGGMDTCKCVSYIKLYMYVYIYRKAGNVCGIKKY